MQFQARTNLCALAVLVAALVLSGCDKPKVVAVAPSAATASAPEVNDNEVTMMVKAALNIDPEINNLEIAVITTKGDVRITGMAETQSQKDRAEKIVREVQGVHAVHDELTIRQ